MATVVSKTKSKQRRLKQNRIRALKVRPADIGSPGYLLAPEKSTEWMQLGMIHFERCDLKAAYQAFLKALDLASEEKDTRSTVEAIAGLLRFSGEALDERKVRYWEEKLDKMLIKHPDEIPPMVWYCKGAIAGFREEWMIAQCHFHRYLRSVREQVRQDGELEVGLMEARGFVMLINAILQRGHLQRARWLAEKILDRIESKNLRGMNGILYMLHGHICESKKDLAIALSWYQKAHAAFIAEHNWYHHLYALYGYARIARMEQNYTLSYWYLDLIEKAAPDAEFGGVLRRELARERARLQQDAVDLLINTDHGWVKTRNGGQISFRKQYVLLDILYELSLAHRSGRGMEGNGLSKAEIIERVWKEDYRPELHDNKLYYNINRLRKLIEPDAKQPKILLNWKEGYRLAPGLKVQAISAGLTKLHRLN